MVPVPTRIVAAALVLACACRNSGPAATAPSSAGSTPALDAGIASASAQTPAARQFEAWLTAFNQGDRATLISWHERTDPVRGSQEKHAADHAPSIEDELDFRRLTGGFDLKKTEESTGTRLVAILQQRDCDPVFCANNNHSRVFSRVVFEVDAAEPHRVTKVHLLVVPPPEEFLSADDRKNGGGPLDAPRRQFLIDGITKELSARYVDPDVAQQMIEALRAHAAHGDYEGITRGEAFAQALTTDLRDVSHDLHVSVDYGPHPPLPPPSQSSPSPEQQARFRATNFGFGAIEHLENNIARVVINNFTPTDVAREAIAGFMTRIADADALIIDLRGNRGGDPETVALVASYLFDAKPVHLNDMFSREDGSTRQSWTLKDVPGKRFGGSKPIYVLTSHQTFSGGEELAYGLQSLHRATLIGETTGGGANPGSPRGIDAWFTIFVPDGRPINPVTKTNWERVGVKPDVPVASDAALDEALRRARRELTTRKH